MVAPSTTTLPLAPAPAPSTHLKAVNGTPVTTFQLDSIESALAAFSQGECLVVVDDLDRENEGDLIIAAEFCSTEMMAWIIRHSSGFICVATSGDRLDTLNLPLMVTPSTDPRKTAYTHTVDYKVDTTTGISAHDRALTARKLADTSADASSFSRPGHICPLRAVPGGVLARTGHTEAAVDLCRLTSLAPVGVICELVKPECPQGSMARRDDCYAFAKQWGLKMITIADLAEYRRTKEGVDGNGVNGNGVNGNGSHSDTSH